MQVDVGRGRLPVGEARNAPWLVDDQKKQEESAAADAGSEAAQPLRRTDETAFSVSKRCGCQPLDELFAAGPALLGVLCQGTGDNRSFLRWQHRQVGSAVQVPGDDLCGRADKRQSSASHLAVGDGEAILIRMPRRLAIEEFRCGIGQCKASGMAGDAAFEHTGQAKIADFELAADKEEVLRFDVAMMDITGMQEVNGVCSLSKVFEQLRSGYSRFAMLPSLPPTIKQRLLRQLHSDNQIVWSFPDAEDLDDVGMPDFLEHLQSLPINRFGMPVDGNKLDSDVFSLEHGAPDLAETSLAHNLHKLEAVNDSSCRWYEWSAAGQSVEPTSCAKCLYSFLQVGQQISPTGTQVRDAGWLAVVFAFFPAKQQLS
ncbi:MAG: hypothetical protein KatS3mg105_3574 [Gemmatales bacterium]|nr:MAG: hypothetical protein KatS3mg105_3574 [Gemmatales bacterium]